MKVNEKNFFVTGIFGLALVFLMALTGCGGSPGTDYDALVQLLPNHDGADFTADEQDEAVDFAVDSMEVIGTVISGINYQSQSSVMPGRAVVEDTYTANGITVYYRVSYGGSTTTVTYKATFNGTFGDYTIKGTGLDIKMVSTVNQKTGEVTANYTYGYVYSVYNSKNGKGMKVVQTGNMTMKQDNSGATMSYNMHFKIYDNNNTVLFNYDYKDTVDV